MQVCESLLGGVLGKMNRKIAVAGTGYVGLSLAVLLAQHNSPSYNSFINRKGY